MLVFLQTKKPVLLVQAFLLDMTILAHPWQCMQQRQSFAKEQVPAQIAHSDTRQAKGKRSPLRRSAMKEIDI